AAPRYVERPAVAPVTTDTAKVDDGKPSKHADRRHRGGGWTAGRIMGELRRYGYAYGGGYGWEPPRPIRKTKRALQGRVFYWAYEAKTYCETVCTTLDTGRVETTGIFMSFAMSFPKASSYSGSVENVVLAFICTTL